ncbi:MAG: hypothetical protein ACI9UK_001917 [Candidatus Krumholzibacteriia bacterium]|jgi:uncharacterized protein YbgA (DUF1722 family)/uncharacterized protein YbbK (DUF523 family)
MKQGGGGMASDQDGKLGNSLEIRVGVSACLMGDEVRYDGSHCNDRYVTGTLAAHFALVRVCPEEEVGMGTPRETVRLIGDVEAPEMIAKGSGTNWTKKMNQWSRRRVRQLEKEQLSGYIFKKNSPSCGVFRVKVYHETGHTHKPGSGLFAAEFARHFPLVPIEEEGRLHDPSLRENFIERVFALDRLKKVFKGRWKRGQVIDFHAREKYLLMAHDPAGLKVLGQLAAAISTHAPTEFRDEYMSQYMKILTKKATTPKHSNALQHVAGYLRTHISPAEQKRVIAIIKEFQVGLVPLIVPITLLRHYIELHDVSYVNNQSYLSPHPRELKLRNHV